MEHNATLDQALPAGGSEPAVEASAESHVEEAVQRGGATRTSQASVSAALAAADGGARTVLPSSVRFPGEDGGQSLAEMAQRDLDAALQLLADRAQYITGAGGAAIALRRSGKNDLQCRASSGENAPELGALLSTEFGLSGESVRTRQPLRCDDAERDARVNREVCRQMGIASVVVMPVMQDDEVLGVIELFSGKVNAFGERDLVALERLGEMVETAVRLAHAAEGLPERLKTVDIGAKGAVAESAVPEVLEIPEPIAELSSEPVLEVEAEAAPESVASVTVPAVVAQVPPPEITPPEIALPEVTPQQDSPMAARPVPAKRPLLWSAQDTNREAQKPAGHDQSHVPPVLRDLRKCQACGFPVSAGRVLCVECEEKKWRGQLKVPKAAANQTSATQVSAARTSDQAATSEPAPRAFAAAAQSVAIPAAAADAQRGSVVDTAATETVSANVAVDDSKKIASLSLPSADLAVSAEGSGAAPENQEPSQASQPEVVFSAGLESSPSWFAANKYILVALLLVAAVVAAVVLLR